MEEEVGERDRASADPEAGIRRVFLASAGE
jgi:hypothetical protein